MSRSKEESLAYYVKQAAVFSRNPRLHRFPNLNFAQRILLRPFRFTGEYVGKGLISQTLLLRAGNFLLSWKSAIIPAAVILLTIPYGSRMIADHPYMITADTANFVYGVAVLTLPGLIVLFNFIFKAQYGLFAYESLRTGSRNEYLRNTGIAILVDILQVWFLVTIAWIFASSIYKSQYVTTLDVIAAIFISLFTQIFLFAFEVWILSLTFSQHRQTLQVALLSAVFGTAAYLIVSTRLDSPYLIALATFIGGLASCITAWSAYRCWCSVELGRSIYGKSSRWNGLLVLQVFLSTVYVVGGIPFISFGFNRIPDELTKDPIIVLNRRHSDLPENAAPFYRQASLLMKGESPNRSESRCMWETGYTVPDSIRHWVKSNSSAFEEFRIATTRTNLWFDLPTLSSMSRNTGRDFKNLWSLCELASWKAKIASDEHDWRTIAETINLIDRAYKHTQQTPVLGPRLWGLSYGGLAQRAVLVPYSWSELSPTELAEYSSSIERIFVNPPSLAEAIRFDCRLNIWEDEKLLNNINWFGRSFDILKYKEDLESFYAGICQIANLPVEKQSDPNSSHFAYRPKPSPVGSVRMRLPDFYEAVSFEPGCFDVLNRRTVLITMQRGNQTAINLFTYRDKHGRFPDSLDEIEGDFEIDPYSGKPFIYKKDNDDFILYSLGIDRDDDGGQHHRKFGKREDAQPDGDYVFWPIPGYEPKVSAKPPVNRDKENANSDTTESQDA